MSIINDPKLLLLDEPLTGLDPTSAITVRHILLELFEEGTTILLSSHNLDEIDRLTNSIYFLKDGEILKESLSNLNSRHYTVTVTDTDKVQDILKEHNYDFTIANKNQVSFSEQSIDLPTFINLMNQNDIAIQDIDKQKLGAEKRYQELFEGVK